MSEKRRGLGRGLGALIPSSAATNGSGNGAAASRPVDLFFPEGRKKTEPVEEPATASVDKTNDPTGDGSTPSAGRAAVGKPAADKSNEETPAPAAAAPAKKTPAQKSPAPSSKAGSAPSPSPAAEKPAPIEATDGPAEAQPAEVNTLADSGVELVEVPGARF